MSGTHLVNFDNDGYADQNLTGNPFLIEAYDLISLHFWADESVDGTIVVQVSNYESQATEGLTSGTDDLADAITEWIDLKDVVPDTNFDNVAVSSGGSVGINLPNIGFKWMRVNFTYSSGASQVYCRWKGKRRTNAIR